MKNINIGVFETPSKTYIKVEDDTGKVIGNETTGPINLHLSVNDAWETVVKSVEKALVSTQITLGSKGYAFHLGLGLRYTQLDYAVKALIRKNKSSSLFKTFIVKSDCYVLTLTKKPNHAVIIVDEGIVGNAITKTDEFKVGGWGFPFMDKGSILWLGSEAYRYTLQWIEGSLDNPTPLLKAIYNHFNNDTAQLIDWAMDDFLNQKYRYRLLSDMVLNFYNLKDKIAIDLIKKSSHEIVKMYEIIKKQANDQNISLSLYGELAKYIVPFLPTKLRSKIEIIYDGTIGAINLVKFSK